MNNKMVKIDLKDKKILYQLDTNCRQSFSQIGKKVGLPKNVVAYRINRLQETGVIKNFYTVINFYKIGYISTRFHYNYQYITPEIEKKIIDYFIENSFTMIVASTNGVYDLSVVLLIKDIKNFYKTWQEIQNNFGYYFQHQYFTFFINETHYRLDYLFPDKSVDLPRKLFEFHGGEKEVKIDETDYKILNEIAGNSRMPSTEIAEKFDCSAMMINNRIKKLIEYGVILGFRTTIDISKLGFQSYKVFIYLSEFKHRNKIIGYLKYNPNLVCIDTTTGESHLELEFHLSSIRFLYEIMHDLLNKFPNVIKNYKYLNLMKVHKCRFLPSE